MTLPMPPVAQHPSPNYTPSAIRHDLVIVHRTEGGYAGSVVWLCNPKVEASAHLVMRINGSEVSQLVPLQYKAWAQKAFNGSGLSLEIEGYTRDGFTSQTQNSAARIVAWLCRSYFIPPVWAAHGQGRGVCQHHDLGVAGGGHVDCCEVGSKEWLLFMGQVRLEFDAFGSGPLPPFALHGLPQPREIAAPHDTPPTPSHGGEARAESTDTVFPHPTVSGFPDGSVADVQWWLNRSGAHISVDGFAGPQTRAAIAAFQGSRRLFVDGIAGPLTRAALRSIP